MGLGNRNRDVATGRIDGRGNRGRIGLFCELWPEDVEPAVPNRRNQMITLNLHLHLFPWCPSREVQQTTIEVDVRDVEGTPKNVEDVDLFACVWVDVLPE